MSQNGVKDTTKLTKRSIPRYVGQKKDNYVSKVESESDKHPVGKPSSRHGYHLSLQGPFRPSIVGARKPEDKRKRNESSEQTKILPSVKSYEDLSPKRNQAIENRREKTKCKVEFKNEADPKFVKGTDEEITHPVKFHAKGQPKAKGYRDLKKNEQELQSHVFQLQDCLSSLRLQKEQQEQSLQLRLGQAQERVSTVEDELKSLKDEIKDKDLRYSETIEEQAHSLNSKNRKLQQRVDDCIQKLQSCNIDPVTLTSMEPDEEERLQLDQARCQSSAQADLLQKKLEESNEKNKKMIANLQKQKESLLDLDMKFEA